MARRTPFAVVLTAVLTALVAVGALVGAAVVRERQAADAPVSSAPAPPSPSPSVGVSGCLVEPCQVLDRVPVAGTTVELVADSGARSGRLRIGGPQSSEVIEVTVTDLGVTLTKSSLQCVARAMSACMVRGEYEGGLAGQVVVGRSGKWSSLTKPFVSSAGYLSLSEVTSTQSGLELVAAQYDCTGAECAGEPVFAQVFAVATGGELGCTDDYDAVEYLPGYPDVTLSGDDLSEC
ncbi:hypothetical protein [Actinophytocola gossypii]|uniref:Uncharacterized protein n=1 Tax=Actinophytocola gossypii TaxID=2812003 RepID=A0ABT2JF82_9PSEU|nr:hypothetical protein [Actinophytocola gossypii]MCT2586189.1 hypothetical protein [Actinophytocola gossypii]